MRYKIGIDMGTSSIKTGVLDEDNRLVFTNKIIHFGNPVQVTKVVIEELISKFNIDNNVVFTGANANLIFDSYYIMQDIPAIQNGLSVICKDAKSAIEIGAQNARFLTDIGKDIPPKFAVNENCAGGTGSFFEDQMYRLGLNMEDYSKICEEATSTPRLSGRCSVFAKTDIIHRQQEGVPTADILLGLCYATIRNLKVTIIKNLNVEKPLALCGGIIHNSGVVKAVKDIFELSDEQLIINNKNDFIQAVGSAKMLDKLKSNITLNDCIDKINNYLLNKDNNNHHVKLEPLKLLNNVKIQEPQCVKIEDITHCSLGIDVGSTSTNIVLINKNREIVDFQYLRTKGNPQGVVKEGLLSLKEKFGKSVIIDSVGVTGSGRYLIGKLIGADSIKDEITAQGKSAFCVNDKVDTVFEIGGQDSKYICIENGNIKDFQMNKICAAGTGSFIEEQAGRLNVELNNYGDIALLSKNPADLGERCTVFIESNISACLSKGIGIPDILAGLSYSIINNYLYKVVGNKPVGNCIVLQGGVCYNPAIVAAFQSVYGDKVMVSPYFSVSGAYGVAVLASEELGNNISNFKGFDLSKESKNKEDDKIINIIKNKTFYDKSKEYLLGDYSRKLDPSKKTIGVPYVLVVHKFFPMIRTYFESLGYNVLLSPDTNEDIIALAQKYAQAETCYPVKLIYGHMAYLAKRNVDYIFLPSILTMKHESSKVYHNYGCVYMQSSTKLIFENMNLDKKGIKLLNPIFSLDYGKKAMASAMIDVGVSLGKSKPRCTQALMSGAMAVRKHTTQVEKLGQELLESLNPDEKVLVMVTRTYGIDDPVLNMGISEELLRRGYKVITLSHLPAHDMDISDEYENLYWPFGQHIISGAKLIKNHPNLYAVYLTNHGCGPDTMLSHLFRQEMGSKPYLNIEVDEHYSKVGVITRIEAFLNSLNSQGETRVKEKAEYFNNLPKRKVDIVKKVDKNTTTYLTNLYPYSNLIATCLNKKGYKIKVLPKTNAESLAIGRSKTMSKEYLSFTSLVGDVLLNSQKSKCNQILIPQTEGSETDGIYARIISDMLPKELKSKIVAPTIETLPFKLENFEELFLYLLAGDIVMSARPEQREKVLNSVESCEELSLSELIKISKGIENSKNRKIAVIGDPLIMFNSYLNEGLLNEMEDNNTTVLWMPLCEYFLFMWKKRAETKGEVNKIKKYEEMLNSISVALRQNSPFSKNIDELLTTAQRNLKDITGGNVAYRYAKQNCLDEVSAVIDVSSMYENAQTVLNLAQNQTKVPVLSLSFEGTNDILAKERLNSFLYYI